MVHVSVRSAPGTLLFRTWREARALWDRLVRAVRFRSLVLMPDHIHLVLADREQLAALATVLRAYALWRNRARGESGPVWTYREQATPIRGRDHVERMVRYVHLNPCRKELVGDPLAWPFSTHRDLVGLVARPVCRATIDPDRFHAFVSADPSVRPEGTRLPAPRRSGAATLVTVAEVRAAVSALTRAPESELGRRSADRTLLVRAARCLTAATTGEIAEALGLHPSTVRRVDPGRDHLVSLVERVVGDPRFPVLENGDLRRLPAWRPYRGRL